MPPPHGMMSLPNSAPPIHGMPPHMMQSHPPPFMQQQLPPHHFNPSGGNMGPPLPKRPYLESEDLMPEQEFVNKNPVSGVGVKSYVWSIR